MLYSAFISYNYRDVRWARWLHRGIETWRVPPRLLGRDGRFGPVAARLPPVFRDREELAASADLGDAIRAALEQAATLIVICSPAAVASRWVNEEIRQFTALGRRDAIRCLIVAGEPHAADPAQECLPPALFENGGTEPLAADLRKGQDSRSAAKLKLLAGILDLPYDELRQREAARRQRRLAVLAAASSIGFVAMAGLAVTAVVARNEAVVQRQLAEKRTMTAERTTDFVKSMFEVSDPSEARGESITAREVLDRGARKIATGLQAEPVVQAELGVTLGEVYGSLGLYRQSDRILNWAGTIRHDQPGVTARQLLGLADSKRRLGEYAAAIALYERGIAIVRHPESGRADLLPRLLVGRGEALTALDRFVPAEAAIREALALDGARLGAGHPDVARELEALGLNALYAGQYAEARPLFERALGIRRQTEGELSPSVADNLNNLASVAYMQRDVTAAERFYRANLVVDEKVLGPEHPDLATTLNNLARMLLERRAFVEADALLQRAVRISLRERGAGHDDMAFQFANLALAEQGVGRHAEAEAYFEKALVAARAHQHRNLGPILVDLGNLRCQMGREAGGMRLIDAAMPVLAKDYPDDPWRTAWARNVRGECLWRGGRPAEGAQLVRDSGAVLAQRWSAQSYYGAEAARRLVLVQPAS